MNRAYAGADAKPSTPTNFAGVLTDGAITVCDRSTKSCGNAAGPLGARPSRAHGEDIVPARRTPQSAAWSAARRPVSLDEEGLDLRGLDSLAEIMRWEPGKPRDDVRNVKSRGFRLNILTEIFTRVTRSDLNSV